MLSLSDEPEIADLLRTHPLWKRKDAREAVARRKSTPSYAAERSKFCANCDGVEWRILRELEQKEPLKALSLVAELQRLAQLRANESTLNEQVKR